LKLFFLIKQGLFKVQGRCKYLFLSEIVYTRQMQDPPASDRTENVPPYRWREGYFGDDLPDPLTYPNRSPEKWNKKRENVGAGVEAKTTRARKTECSPAVLELIESWF